ncbi:hypothetical protein L1049_019294 [Liquidambar formosana]|uniref:F-box domain-containing protein n=1 Tax=Liquidambar formosana TaxID=63359 RepID=A0AAP0S5J3_LIQFO
MGTKGGEIACGADFYVLPEGCIANILSLTTPPDACRLSLVSPIFRSAAESDDVWERFLPADYQAIVARSDGFSPAVIGSKKKLYLHHCDAPLLIDGGRKSFSLDKWSGKKCYMIAARSLTIIWGDTPDYWGWISLPESRFEEVAELRAVCWLEIRGKINTGMLSPETTYGAYLVCKYKSAYGLDYCTADVSVGILGCESFVQTVYLDPAAGERQPKKQRHVGVVSRRHRRRAFMLASQAAVPREGDGRKMPKERGDGWFEIELGEYVHKGGEDEELEMSLKEVKTLHWKGGLIVQGIEIRPKEGNP